MATFVCSSYERVGIDRSIVDTEDWESPIWRDSRFKYLLNLEEKPLIRDRYCLAHFSWLNNSSGLQRARCQRSLRKR